MHFNMGNMLAGTGLANWASTLSVLLESWIHVFRFYTFRKNCFTVLAPVRYYCNLSDTVIVAQLWGFGANQMTPNSFVLLPNLSKFTCRDRRHSTKAHNGELLNSLWNVLVGCLENWNVLVDTLKVHSTFLIVFWSWRKTLPFEERNSQGGRAERQQMRRWNEDGDKQLERLCGREQRDCGISCQGEAATRIRERGGRLIGRFHEEKTRDERTGKGQKCLQGFLRALSTRVTLKRSQLVKQLWCFIHIVRGRYWTCCVYTKLMCWRSYRQRETDCVN